MQIFLFRNTEDAEEKAQAYGLYYLGYTMLHMAVIVAETKEAAREILVQETEEEVYKYEDVIECLHLGTTVDPWNSAKLIHASYGTG